MRRRLELGLTDAERRERARWGKARNCLFVVLAGLVLVGMFGM